MRIRTSVSSRSRQRVSRRPDWAGSRTAPRHSSNFDPRSASPTDLDCCFKGVMEAFTKELQEKWSPRADVLLTPELAGSILSKFEGRGVAAADAVMRSWRETTSMELALAAGLVAKTGATDPASLPVPPWSGAAEKGQENADKGGNHRGILLIDGGELADRNLEAYRTIVEFAGGTSKAVIGVLDVCTCALAPDQAGEYSHFQTWFHKWNNAVISFNAAGFPTSRLIHLPFTLDVRNRRDDENIAELVKRCSGIWIPGGEHYRTMQSLFHQDLGADGETHRGRPSRVLQALREVYRSGAVVAGTSSGAFIATAGPLITGGQNYTALAEGTSVDLVGLRPELTFDPHGGLGLLNGPKWAGALVDAHCARKSRVLRLVRLILDTRHHVPPRKKNQESKLANNGGDAEEGGGIGRGTAYGIGLGENTQLF